MKTENLESYFEHESHRKPALYEAAQTEWRALKEEIEYMKAAIGLAAEWYNFFAQAQEPQEENGTCPGNIARAVREALDTCLRGGPPDKTLLIAWQQDERPAKQALEFIAQQGCENKWAEGCAKATLRLCLTEYCLPCYAKAHL